MSAAAFTPQDSTFMARALKLAQQGIYSTKPNPAVGCVIVLNNEIVGEGFHQQAGGPHAEVFAIKQAGEKTKGAVAYVTLEPCAHQGKTGPCAEALVAAGVSRVIAAMQDPNPQVAGKGFTILENAGISTAYGLMESEAKAITPGFIKRMETGLPLLRLKQAMSLDGRTAMASGESQWITGPEARSDVQALRARSGAIISGVDSVIQDDSSLTVRAEQLPAFFNQTAFDSKTLSDIVIADQPLRVVLDSKLRLSANANILKQAGKTLVVCAAEELGKKAELEQAGAEVLCLPNQDGQVDLPALLKLLGDRQINDVLLETGADLAGSFVRQGLVDEFWIYMAAKLMGNQARGLLNLPLESMNQAIDLTVKDIRAIGVDWRIIASPK